jgi:hypothetical protein
MGGMLKAKAAVVVAKQPTKLAPAQKKARARNSPRPMNV